MAKKKILVVDDEKDIINLLSFHMKISGYQVISVRSGVEALESAKTEKPDLIILDIMLPRIDGCEVAKRLKRDPDTSRIPIIMLSALAETSDKIKGFYAGADDYLTKPFSPRELMVRIKRILARLSESKDLASRLRFANIELDLEGCLLIKNGKKITVTRIEFALLKMFINNPGRVIGQEQILDLIWGENNIVEYGNIEVHIRHLREKIEDDPQEPRIIKTIKGQGYKFEADI